MPGLLKPTAVCPKCGDGIVCLSDLTLAYGEGVVREFFHERMPGAKRRRSPCVQTFTDVEQAAKERAALEIHL